MIHVSITGMGSDFASYQKSSPASVLTHPVTQWALGQENSFILD
jgi:hypothetical protein